ncbi:MAG: TetR/AcrR family transcriptional regulator [Gammaproteobacteria bacterium]
MHPTTKPPGRPRCEAARQAILRATKKLLKTTTLRDLAIEAIAKEAGVGKTTIYRWWPNKAAIVIDAFFDCAYPKTGFPEAPTAAQAIAEKFRRVVETFRSREGRIVAELIAEGQSDPTVLQHFRSACLQHWRTAARAVIAQGIAAGEFAADLDIELAMDLIWAPIYFRLLVAHQPLDDAFAEALPKMALQALRAG